jgi:hypothetical protein
MVVKTFRGQLADGGQDRIRLSTIKGKVGYRISKFQIMTSQPFAGATSEHVIKIWSDKQTIPYTDSDVNLSDNTVLGVAITTNHTTGYANPIPLVVIFDKVTFNQDIYITHTDSSNAQACNYYLELEVIPLDDAGAEYTTLKDMRSTGT